MFGFGWNWVVFSTYPSFVDFEKKHIGSVLSNLSVSIRCPENSFIYPD